MLLLLVSLRTLNKQFLIILINTQRIELTLSILQLGLNKVSIISYYYDTNDST